MQKKQYFGIVLIAAFALPVAGCVQPASEELAPTQVGANATWTNTPPPTLTPTATEPATATPEADDDEADTETPEPDTPTPTPTDAQSAFVAQDDSEATLVAQDDTNPIDPNAGDTGDTGAQVSESQLTATAIIAGATATQSFIQTATAAGLGVGVATPTPTATSTAQVDLGTTPVPNVNVPAGADCFHEVKAVDRSLYRLSLAYGVSVNSIAQASGIVNPDLIRVGQMLTIPGCGTTGAVPPPTSTPNPNAVPSGTGGVGGTGGFAPANPSGDCTWGTSVIFPNGCPTGSTGTTTGSTGTTDTAASTGTGTGGPGTTAGSRVHTVQQGETLYEISLTYGVTMDAIASANGIANYDQIVFNDQLVIP